MSKYVITTVSDRLTGAKGLTLEVNDQAAIRAFTQAVKNKDSLVHANKEDFELIALGTYDPDLAVIETYDKPVVLCRGVDINV